MKNKINSSFITKISENDLISLRKGIPSYPVYYKRNKVFSLSFDKFISFEEILIVLKSINVKEKHAYKCLLGNELVYISDLNEDHLKLNVRFCFIKA
tara:strand:- start:126 stop:416 length:291 start_codon:yes stop_codon:yes gene_type:complete